MATLAVALAVSSSLEAGALVLEAAFPLAQARLGAGRSETVTKISGLAGTLRFPVYAFGGETTGMVLKTAAGSYELAFASQPVDEKLFEQLDGKSIEVAGDLTSRPGVEVGTRRIITVLRLRVAPEKTVEGILRGPGAAGGKALEPEIAAATERWALDLGGDPKLRDLTRQWDGKAVIATGSLVVRRDAKAVLEVRELQLKP
ncbi:MAG: hypothetical protein HY554_08880 [Elusimicrobia bacterium]|nr:hypothetical protein [Elusimicrobiota bacterium]